MWICQEMTWNILWVLVIRSWLQWKKRFDRMNNVLACYKIHLCASLCKRITLAGTLQHLDDTNLWKQLFVLGLSPWKTAWSLLVWKPSSSVPAAITAKSQWSKAAAHLMPSNAPQLTSFIALLRLLELTATVLVGKSYRKNIYVNERNLNKSCRKQIDR